MILEVPEGLGARGQQMWRQSVELWALTPAHLVLLEEACRLADRLDVLHAIIRRVSMEVNGGEDQLDDIQGALAEARLQSAALKSLVVEIRQGQSGAAPTTGTGGQGVSDLTARIAARRQQAES